MDVITKCRRKSLFASREELCSELGEVEKCQDGIFQRTSSRLQAEALLPAGLLAQDRRRARV